MMEYSRGWVVNAGNVLNVFTRFDHEDSDTGNFGEAACNSETYIIFSNQSMVLERTNVPARPPPTIT
jgi:hypothetical protein